MISKDNLCYVYMTLPKQTEPITVGKFVIEDNVGRFVYGRSYLARHDAVDIDPIELKLTDKVLETAKMSGMFGAIRDASPDHWGRRVIERHLKQAEVSEMEYLLNSPDDRIGALGFGLNKEPPAPLRKFNKAIDLEKLQTIADTIINDEICGRPERAQIEELLLIGTSMGGARPKAVVFDQTALWLAKFNCDKDKWNNALVEHAILRLAALCGINTAQSRIERVGGKDVLMVKRFDRDWTGNGFSRRRMFSALTALRGDDSPTAQNWSYLALAEEIRRISTQPKDDAKELFTRMTFNALISNTDDHPRNHAFLGGAQTDWHLSPAYDLTPTPSVSTEHRDLAMSVGNMGRWANAKNLLSECQRFSLTPTQAENIVNTTAEIVKKNWYATLRNAGVSERDCEKLNSAFVYDGFWI